MIDAWALSGARTTILDMSPNEETVRTGGTEMNDDQSTLAWNTGLRDETRIEKDGWDVSSVLYVDGGGSIFRSVIFESSVL